MKPAIDELVALERGALDRWVKLDPKGYLDLYASEVTYSTRTPNTVSPALTPCERASRRSRR